MLRTGLMQLPKGIDIVLVVPLIEPTGSPVQYLDVEILAACVRSSGFSAALLDGQLHGLSVAESLEVAVQAQPALVYWHLPGRRQYQAVAGALAQPVDAAGIRMVAGGYFASRHSATILSAMDGLDAIVHNELEGPITSLLRGLARGDSWDESPGLAVRRGGMVVHNPPGRLLEDLDALPMAAEDLFHAGRFRSGQKVLINRGCNSNCSYCGLQVPYRKAFTDSQGFWRSRSPRRIADEIEVYVTRHGIERFVFEAFVLFGYDKHGEDVIGGIVEEIELRRLEIEISFVTHPGALARNRHLLPQLRRAGLRDLYLGIDSGLERALRLYRVEFGISDIYAALDALHYYGIPFNVGFFFFDPYMTFHEVREQLAFLRSLRPYFGHMPQPYSFFLDQQLLGSALHLNSEMPLVAMLAADGLLVPTDPLAADPAARFADARTGRYYAAHRRLRRGEAFHAFRQISAPCVREAAFEELPLDVAEDLWEILAAHPEMSVDEAAAAAEERLRQRLEDSGKSAIEISEFAL
ncbi:MAG TPA: radical SAM protein [Thermoanaerobaculia bacterium]|nr:radical SAM protein [Thermoanaerobaculia bacterium]